MESDEAALLIDAGLSGKEIQRRIETAGLSTSKLKAILISHEHRDHVHGAGILARRLKLPLYANSLTLARGAWAIGECQTSVFKTGMKFDCGPFGIHPFSVSHDAADPVGFTITSNGSRLGLATDLGIATNLVKTHLAGCHALILESNHDHQMLMDGPYPWELKRRVQGRLGHLSNSDAAALLAELAHENLNRVVLAHLSEINNEPELALQTARAVRSDLSSNYQGKPFGIEVAGQYQPGPCFVME